MIVGVLQMSPEEFEDLVAEALDEIPDELARLVDNVVIVVEDDVARGPMSGCSASTRASR